MVKIKNIVVLTGAGISAESGIRTFRDTGGLWEEHSIEKVATPEAYAADPELVLGFYNARRAQLSTVEPNPAHHALGRLEKGLLDGGGYLTLVTQNVDDLHERGGADNVIHMHGELLSQWCRACDSKFKSRDDFTTSSVCPKCDHIGRVRPDIVWFGEMPYSMGAIETAVNNCDLFVSIGTSGAVYPAAGFVQLARGMRKQTLEINLEPSEGSSFFHDSRLGKAGELVPIWVDEILEALT
ncbi:MAG: NAD-dependent deacylase [Hellea sp.]|nr:NAD-dependent deacylase [Hellea sp.]